MRRGDTEQVAAASASGNMQAFHMSGVQDKGIGATESNMILGDHKCLIEPMC